MHKFNCEEFLTEIYGIPPNIINEVLDKGVYKNTKLINISDTFTVDDILYSEHPSFKQVEPENLPLNLLYEDKHIAVINKPINLIVHPGPLKGTWQIGYSIILTHYRQFLVVFVQVLFIDLIKILKD